MTIEAIRERFAQIVAGPEDKIDLIEAALMIARTAFPDLISSRYTIPLDRWSEQLLKHAGPSSSAGEIACGLNHILFDQEGFKGNVDDYYDPQNSFLNRVIERKMGIPISLSVIYAQVGRRAGFPVYGISLPGHFMAGVFHDTGTLYVDAFNQGEILTESECCTMVEERFGQETANGNSWKAIAGKKVVLARMLRNLKAIYHHLGQGLRAFEMIQWILVLDPDAPEELKERGLLYEAIGNDAYAARDLKHYLAVASPAPDEEIIRSKIRLLEDSRRQIH